MTTLISGDARLSHATGMVAAVLTGGELVVLDRDYAYLTLNDTASRVWELLDEPHRFDDLVTALTEEFHVTREECVDDLLPLLETFVERGCVVVSPPADPGPGDGAAP